MVQMTFKTSFLFRNLNKCITKRKYSPQNHSSKNLFYSKIGQKDIPKLLDMYFNSYISDINTKENIGARKGGRCVAVEQDLINVLIQGISIKVSRLKPKSCIDL